MLKSLHEMVESTNTLSNGLMQNGGNHLQYKQYTSMERALALLITGNMYLSSGSSWNDKPDRDQMKKKQAFGSCFTRSTVENVAFWMLYSGDNGKKGAMLSFPRKTMQEILQVNEIDLGCFRKGEFCAVHTLRNIKGEAPAFRLLLTDIIYTRAVKSKERQAELQLTLGDEHRTVRAELVEDKTIFTKRYPWAYEKESRLIASLSDGWYETVEREKLTNIRIKLNSSQLKQLKDNLVRSPVYSGGTDCGKKSELYDQVDWTL